MAASWILRLLYVCLVAPRASLIALDGTLHSRRFMRTPLVVAQPKLGQRGWPLMKLFRHSPMPHGLPQRAVKAFDLSLRLRIAHPPIEQSSPLLDQPQRNPA